MIQWQKGSRKGRGLILDEPVGGVLGIVECAAIECGRKAVLTADRCSDPDQMIAAIESFLVDHPCQAEVTPMTRPATQQPGRAKRPSSS